jgi:penicillin-binding protein 1A
VRLLGIDGEGGRAARSLRRFLRRNEVACEPVGDFHRCRVRGYDLSQIILLAGGARATVDAPAELLAAQDQARAERAGIWRRRR